MVTEERIFSGRYCVVALLGEGGMARVYKALDERLRRVVALKTLHAVFNHEPQFLARFEREARLAAGLSHPNIVNVYDIATDGSGAHYIVMEYVAGETLKDLTGREAPLIPEACLPLLRQLCLALDYAHERGVIHRDIKPANIFLTATRHVKVGDFGIARALDSTGLTTTGMVLGSASYLSPEQAQGQPATAQSDIYATGVVLFELLTGRLPFTATTPLAMAMKHVEERPPSPSSVNPSLPRGLDAVVLKALSKDPAARYGSGAELVAALERAIASPEPAAAAPLILQPGAPVPPLSIGELAARRRAAPAETGGSGVVVAPRPRSRPSRRRWLVTPLAVAAAAGLAWATTQGGVPTANRRPQRHATAGARTGHQHAAVPSATSVPYAAVSAARHTHDPRHVRPVAPRRQPTATSALRVTLEIARGESQTGATYIAQGRTTRFTTASVAAYAVARWRAGGPHRFLFRWTTPDGHGDSYGGVNTTGSAYAEIPLAATGTYHVTLSIDKRRLATRTFTVAPAAALSPEAPSQTATPSLSPTNVSTVTSAPSVAPAAPPVLPTRTVAAVAPPSGPVQGAPITQIEQAVSYANDVYMQVMNDRNTSGVDSAFGAALATTNRAVAAGLAARHEHYAIQLLRLSFNGVTMIGPTTARVSVTKTESDPLYSDSGRMRQKSELVVVRSHRVGYPSPFIGVHGGGNDGLPILWGRRDIPTGAGDSAGLRAVPLPSLPTHLQRAHGHALQPSAGPHGRRAPRRPVAAALQTQPARPGRDVPDPWLHVHARDGAGVGGTLRPVVDRAPTGQATRQSGPPVARRRDVREGERPLVLPVSRHRRRWEPGGLHAQ